MQGQKGDGALDQYWERMKNAYEEVYSEVAADHMIFPRNTDELIEHSCFGMACDDRNESMAIWLKINDNHVVDACFSQSECHVCNGCASVTTEWVRGKSISQSLGFAVETLVGELHGLPDEDLPCAELAVRALHSAINNYGI